MHIFEEEGGRQRDHVYHVNQRQTKHTQRIIIIIIFDGAFFFFPFSINFVSLQERRSKASRQASMAF